MPGQVPSRARLLLRRGVRSVRSALVGSPLTVGYVGAFTLSTVLQRTMPAAWLDRALAYSSTNVERLSAQPVRALLSSAFWVADEGRGYVLYVGGFALAVAWAERRMGTARLLAIALGTHVLASLAMVAGEEAAIRLGIAPPGLAATVDVGVSYVLVGGCVAAAVTLSPRMRAGALAALALLVTVPLLVDGDLWDAGHLVALACAMGTAFVVLRLAPMTPGVARQLSTSVVAPGAAAVAG